MDDSNYTPNEIVFTIYPSPNLSQTLLVKRAPGFVIAWSMITRSQIECGNSKGSTWFILMKAPNSWAIAGKEAVIWCLTSPCMMSLPPRCSFTSHHWRNMKQKWLRYMTSPKITAPFIKAQCHPSINLYAWASERYTFSKLLSLGMLLGRVSGGVGMTYT